MQVHHSLMSVNEQIRKLNFTIAAKGARKQNSEIKDAVTSNDRIISTLEESAALLRKQNKMLVGSNKMAEIADGVGITVDSGSMDVIAKIQELLGSLQKNELVLDPLDATQELELRTPVPPQRASNKSQKELAELSEVAAFSLNA